MKNTNENPSASLTPEKFQAIAGAFARLQSLGEKQIAAGPGDNSLEEKEKLLTFLASEMLAHISEFLACYQLVHVEYIPLITGLQRLAIRAGYHPKAAPANPVNPALN